MQTNAIQIWSGVNRRRYEHYYDYLNRRVRTDTLAAVGSSWLAIRHSTFFYEGWNMIREKIYDADQGATDYRTYAWGLDIVGSLSSSGGVQGLIAMRDRVDRKPEIFVKYQKMMSSSRPTSSSCPKPVINHRQRVYAGKFPFGGH
jgi:hypothetical protein